MSDDLVKVAVRIRPLISSEIEKGCQTCVKKVPGEPQIQIQTTEKAFTFNYVFPPECSQKDFYNTAIKNMVKNVFEGYNVTILAYGQTGSGKTYSMGTNYEENNESVGVIPRAINDIFEFINKNSDWDFKVSVAFMELYKEQLYDLLSKKPRNQNLVDIREDLKGIKMFGLSEIEVDNTQKTLECLSNGSACRATGSTAMNNQSSRSHAIFTLSIQQQKKDDPSSLKFAKFHFVDLAGSERSKKTQATGERFKEGVNINKGLLALGNVISQLGEGGNASYIGYRDSKLTRLLQDSLGGNSVTLMIACVSPADYNSDETISTLRYADRARKIKNKPIVNQDERFIEILNLKKIIQDLKSTIVAQQSGSNFCPVEHIELQEKNESLLRKVRSLTEKLNANLIKIVHLHEQADLTEQAMEQTKLSISKIFEYCEKLIEEINDDPTNTENVKSKLQSICLQITDLQKDQKRVIDELVNRELSVEMSFNSDVSTSESQTSNIDESDVHNETYDLDEKNEEHTLQQFERIDLVQSINKQLAIKEELVSNLLKNSPQMIEYQKELEEMEIEVKNLQKEKEELLQALRVAKANNASTKLAETRRKKVQELEKKISELSQKCLQQTKVIKTKEKSDQQIKNLSSEILSLKQTKIKLLKSMRTEADKFSKWKKSKEQELRRLKEMDRKHLNQLTRMEAQHTRQKNVFKRKLEEAQSINKRLKDALDLQKKNKKEKFSNSKEDARLWVTQELEVLLSTVEAECTLEKLKQDKEEFTNQLAALQQGSPDDNGNNKKDIDELVEYLNLRNNQISDLEQHIKESNQENRSKTRWHMISSMGDARIALQTLFDTATANEKRYNFLKQQNKELMERQEKLKEQLVEYELKLKSYVNKNLKLEIIDNTINNNSQNDESSKENKVVNDLEEQVKFYKQQCEDLQSKLITEKDSKDKSKSRPKPIKQTILTDSFNLSDESFCAEDDDNKDPDWRNTPLFVRIKKSMVQKPENTKPGTKRSSNGDVKCNCKQTKCASRLCSCRKNDMACENCNCDPEHCQNKLGEMTRRTLFNETKEMLNPSENKKLKIIEES